MSDATVFRSLHLHSLNSLLAALVNGQTVGLEGKPSFSLGTVEARALLAWYRANLSAWSKNVTVKTLHDLIAAVDRTPSAVPSVPATLGMRRVFAPKRVEIHRFGGVQEYDSEETLSIDLNAPLLLLEGQNGSGKTSILNAIIWCLTGKLCRAQRAPTDGQEAIALRLEGEEPPADAEEASDTTIASVLACPVPPKSVLAALDGNPLPLNTWVAITFVEQGSWQEFEVRRLLCRGKNGKPEIKVTGIDELQLDPVAFEVGTVMPGLLPHVCIGAESDFGRAIAELTGLAPLRLLVKHAKQVAKRIDSDLIRKDYSDALSGAETRFLNARGQLASMTTEHPSLALSGIVALSMTATNAGSQLDVAVNAIKAWQATAYADALKILGETFDPNDLVTRKALDGKVVLAQSALAFSAIATLPSTATLNGLHSLKDQSLDSCEAALSAFRAEARELRQLASDPARESRMRLYVRVANWLRDTGHSASPDTCPVCFKPYGDAVDPATGRAPHEHLADSLNDGKAYLELSLAAWANGALGTLARDLPEALSKAMVLDLPPAPVDLLRAALVAELFETDAFRGVLAPLKARVIALCDTHLRTLPAFLNPSPDKTLLGEPTFARLEEALNRLDRAIAFARWRKSVQNEWTAAVLAIIGRPNNDTATDVPQEQPLARQVEALANIVRTVAPSAVALAHIATMQRELGVRSATEKEIARAGKAITHLAALFPLGDLAQEQLEALRGRLDRETKLWMNGLYRAATTGTAPNPRQSQVDTKGTLDVLVERNGTLASAEHVGNASFLRAYLLAFLFAFWQHIRDTRGGLSLLVLDDPQELLDTNNRLRLAETLGHLIAAKATALVSTHNPGFAFEVRGSHRCRNGLDHRSVHGRNANRPCTQLAPAISDLDRKRKAFKENQDDHQMARDYAGNFRIFVEAQLSDLFDRPAYAQRKKMMLADLLGELRRQAALADGLSGPVVDALCSDGALQPGSAFLRLLNTLHHADAQTVTWGDVNQHVGDFERVCTLVLDVHDEYRRWLRRDLPAFETAPVIRLAPMQRPTFDKLERCHDLAAFSVDEGSSGSEASGDPLPASWFADKSLFTLCADTLGFAAPMGSVLIVESESSDVEDHRLAVAIHGGHHYARRILRSSDLPGRIVLAAETGDPSRRLAPIIAPVEDVQLHKVVGVLFTNRPFHPRDTGEAIPLPFHRRLTELRKVYCARGSSGIPLVLDGQTVLGGAAIAAGGIDLHRQRLVAVRADGGAFFKRVGEPLPGLPHLRLFESVGGLGDSLVIQMEPLEEDKRDLPQFLGAREVIGVLYG